MSLQKILASSCCILLLAGSSFCHAEEATKDNHYLITPSQMKWVKAPDSLPSGAMATVLEGDPSKEGPFTLRFKMPANYKIPPHFHPAIEHVTVISGQMALGMGDKFDLKSATRLPAGSFFYMEPGMHHYAYTKVPTVIQLHGMGPWGITYIDPKDDPRNKGKE